MLTVYPDYYPKFKCIASRCRHNCCIGWEIDIDPAAMEKYSAMEGEMGRRLAQNIARDADPPHFVLGANERCPFLNGDNLCDLILHGGDGLLCDICADHPRFRNELTDRTEMGLGLCCEAAAELILGCRHPVALLTAGEGEEADEYETFILALRDKAIAAAQNRAEDVPARLENVLRICGAANYDLSIPRLRRLYSDLERLDEAWTARLDGLAQAPAEAELAAFHHRVAAQGCGLEQLLVYFLYRHIAGACDDGDIPGRAALCVSAVTLICAMGARQLRDTGAFAPADLVELARMYSAEVEYSDENVDALLDVL